ncbi:uncharacterized protein RCC_07043 [Ramularia collo-cygni]|uniref:Methyltransferase domain-containing protein n=1 Tax=Ramularia collo-cygni TaxID=112498 RepID=A0A2D3UWL8_9PEZI|nr:uncharacterized protein RCC_07043 [Ramularia collo-cygni]CZT21181.1 uncharacterized protein RCC_07043 [Ramularia collo-cygni]
MATSSTDLKTIGTINREFFDKYAGFVSNEGWIRDLHEQIRDFLKQNINKIASPQEGLKMLDYACGNGIISTAPK